MTKRLPKCVHTLSGTSHLGLIGERVLKVTASGRKKETKALIL